MNQNPNIEYELHDSVITGVDIDPKNEVSFTIDLYSIYYPEQETIILRFGGIENFESVAKYARKIINESDKDEIGCGIENFQYDSKKTSNANSYWFYLETSWEGPQRIHCSKMTMELKEK